MSEDAKLSTNKPKNVSLNNFNPFHTKKKKKQKTKNKKQKKKNKKKQKTKKNYVFEKQ